MSDIIERLEWRYAVKKFNENKKLSEGQIARLKQAFNLTATSYGLQPIKLVVVQNKELQKELVAHSYQQTQVAQASHLLVFCVESNIDSHYISSYFKRVKEVRGTPEEVLSPFKQSLVNEFTNKAPEEVFTWATKQAYLAMGNLLTFCAVEKIDACPMEGFVPEQYNKVLGLKAQGLSAVLAMPIGYRAQDDMFSEFKKVRRKLSTSIIDIQ